MSLKRIVLTIIIVVSFCFCIVEAKEAVDNNSKVSVINTIVSPGGEYVVTTMGLYDQEPNFRVFLEDVKSKIKKPVYSYNRHVDMAWSTNGVKFFITDYGGSDFADCFIFTPGDQFKKISIQEELEHQMPTNRTIFKQGNDTQHFNDHVYITCNKWLDDNSVLIKIYGHGAVDPNGFTLWYKYTINSGFQFIKKENFNDS